MGLVDYVRGTKGELKHVSWPTQRQAFIYAVLVVILSLAVAAFLGGIDYLFSQGIDVIVNTFRS